MVYYCFNLDRDFRYTHKFYDFVELSLKDCEPTSNYTRQYRILCDKGCKTNVPLDDIVSKFTPNHMSIISGFGIMVLAGTHENVTGNVLLFSTMISSRFSNTSSV